MVSQSPPPMTTCPMWLTSKRPALSRVCVCSAMMPAGYCTGISYPAKGTILPPSSRCSACSGVCRRSVIPRSKTQAGAILNKIRRGIPRVRGACPRGDAPSVRWSEIAIPSASRFRSGNSPESCRASRSLGLRVSGAVAPSAPAFRRFSHDAGARYPLALRASRGRSAPGRRRVPAGAAHHARSKTRSAAGQRPTVPSGGRLGDGSATIEGRCAWGDKVQTTSRGRPPGGLALTSTCAGWTCTPALSRVRS